MSESDDVKGAPAALSALVDMTLVVSTDDETVSLSDVTERTQKKTNKDSTIQDVSIFITRSSAYFQFIDTGQNGAPVSLNIT